MKVVIRGSIYKAKKLGTRRHYCTTCDAHRCITLCQEIRANLFSKKVKTCQQLNIVWRDVGASVKRGSFHEELKEFNHTKDKYSYNLLSNFILTVQNVLDDIVNGRTLNPKKITILKTYIQKIKLTFHIK